MARALADIQADLDAAYAARRKVLTSQAYGIGGRTVTRANLRDIQAMVQSFEQEKASALAGQLGQGSIQMIPTKRGW